MTAVITFVIALLIVAVVVAISLYTTDKVGDKMTADGSYAAASATITMIDEMAEIPGWVGILVVAFFGVLIISLFLGMRYINQ